MEKNPIYSGNFVLKLLTDIAWQFITLAKMLHWPNVYSMLGQGRRLWYDIEPSFGKHFLFANNIQIIVRKTIQVIIRLLQVWHARVA